MSLHLSGKVRENHRHLKIIDCVTAHVFFISTVNGRSKKKEKKPIMSCTSSGHINKLKQSIFAPLISMEKINENKQKNTGFAPQPVCLCECVCALYEYLQNDYNYLS